MVWSLSSRSAASAVSVRLVCCSSALAWALLGAAVWIRAALRSAWRAVTAVDIGARTSSSARCSCRSRATSWAVLTVAKPQRASSETTGTTSSEMIFARTVLGRRVRRPCGPDVCCVSSRCASRSALSSAAWPRVRAASARRGRGTGPGAGRRAGVRGRAGWAHGLLVPGVELGRGERGLCCDVRASRTERRRGRGSRPGAGITSALRGARRGRVGRRFRGALGGDVGGALPGRRRQGDERRGQEEV